MTTLLFLHVAMTSSLLTARTTAAAALGGGGVPTTAVGAPEVDDEYVVDDDEEAEDAETGNSKAGLLYALRKLCQIELFRCEMYINGNRCIIRQ